MRPVIKSGSSGATKPQKVSGACLGSCWRKKQFTGECQNCTVQVMHAVHCLGVCPENLGFVMQRFYQDCLDKADPSTYFNRSDWTAAGAPADDMDAQRVCATEFARQADKALDERIR